MKSNKSNYNNDPMFDKCPSCGFTNTIRRSHSHNAKEKFFNHFTFYRTFRCNNCGWRGFRITRILGAKTYKNLLLYLGILILTAFITYQILKNIF